MEFVNLFSSKDVKHGKAKPYKKAGRRKCYNISRQKKYGKSNFSFWYYLFHIAKYYKPAAAAAVVAITSRI